MAPALTNRLFRLRIISYWLLKSSTVFFVEFSLTGLFCTFCGVLVLVSKRRCLSKYSGEFLGGCPHHQYNHVM